MKTNKKIITTSILILTLILLLSTISYAKPFTDAFSGGLVQINNFFANEQYKPYAKAIDFFFFALLFIAIYMMGARYAFKEVKRPEQVIVILLGLMTAFLLVLGGFSAVILLPYIHWLLYVLLFILYWWLLKGIKNPFWRFVLALLLTLLTIALIQGLFGALTAPEIGAPDTTGIGGFFKSFGDGGFFKSFGDAFKGIELPGVAAPGVPSWLSDLYGTPTTAPTGPTTLPTATTPSGAPAPSAAEKGFFGRNWWWILLLLILLALLGLAYKKGWIKKPERIPTEPTTTPTPQEELTIQKIIDDIGNYIKKKLEILNKINEIVARKKSLTKLQRDLYYKAIEFDQAYWIDPDSEANKLFEKHGETLGALLKLELELEKELKELMDIEKELVGVVGERFGKLIISPYKRGKAGRWIILLEGSFDEKRSKEIAEEIDKIEKLTPLLWREKFLDLVYRLLNVKEVPEWYKTRFKQITNLIDELIMTYRWDPQTMRLIIREPQLIQKPDGTNEIARDDNGRIIWTYPSNIPGQPETIVPGGRYARWIINPDDMKILQAGWFSDSPSICEVVMRYISYYLLLTKEQDYKQKAWRKLIHPKQLEKVVKNKDRWKAIKKLWKGKPQDEIPDILSRHFEEENAFFNTQFKPAVYKELQHMYEIIRHLKYLTSEREETTMQELRVEYFDAAGEKKEYSEGSLRDQNFAIPVIPRDKFIRVYTLLATGKGPAFKLACSVRTPPDNPLGGQFIRSDELVRGTTNRYLPRTKPYEKTEAHPIFEWKSEEFHDEFGDKRDKLTDGEHEIYLYLVGPKPAETPQTPIAQSYKDVRSIRVGIGQGITAELLRINKPAPNSPHQIGSYIDDLEAEAISTDENWNYAINSGNDARMHFEWYIAQGTNTERLHLGRTGPKNFVSKPIPINFSPGTAKLGVILHNVEEKLDIAVAEIDINLVPPTTPPRPTIPPGATIPGIAPPGRVLTGGTPPGLVMLPGAPTALPAKQLNINIQIDPPSASNPDPKSGGVSVNEQVTFKVTNDGTLPFHLVTRFKDEKGKYHDRKIDSNEATPEFHEFFEKNGILSLLIYDSTGRKGFASIHIYVRKEEPTLQFLQPPAIKIIQPSKTGKSEYIIGGYIDELKAQESGLPKGTPLYFKWFIVPSSGPPVVIAQSRNETNVPIPNNLIDQSVILRVELQDLSEKLIDKDEIDILLKPSFMKMYDVILDLFSTLSREESLKKQQLEDSKKVIEDSYRNKIFDDELYQYFSSLVKDIENKNIEEVVKALEEIKERLRERLEGVIKVHREKPKDKYFKEEVDKLKGIIILIDKLVRKLLRYEKLGRPKTLSRIKKDEIDESVE